MVRAWFRGVAAIGLLAAVLAVAAPCDAAVQGEDDVQALNERVVELYNQGKLAEAAALAGKALALAERR